MAGTLRVDCQSTAASAALAAAIPVAAVESRWVLSSQFFSFCSGGKAWFACVCLQPNLPKAKNRRHFSALPMIRQFHGVDVRPEDLEGLQRPRAWLGDGVLAFFQEYFHHEAFKQQQQAGLSFMQPATVFLAKFLDPCSLRTDVVEPLSLQQKELVFMPLSDNTDPSVAEGGSHWALLLLDRWSRRCFLLDSLPTTTARMADSSALGRKMAAAVGCGMDACGDVVPVPCPQQANAFDCGIYVIGFIHAVASEFLEHPPPASRNAGTMLAWITQAVDSRPLPRKSDWLAVMQRAVR